jgi:hypothetical protein
VMGGLTNWRGGTRKNQLRSIFLDNTKVPEVPVPSSITAPSSLITSLP